MIANEILIDESIKLKKLTRSDAHVIFNAIDSNRDHLRKWLPFVDGTKGVKDTQAFVDSIVEGDDFRQEIFTIWYKTEFCGLLGLKDIDYLNLKVELGYWMVEHMTGKGIVTRSVAKIMELCFTNLDLNRIQIKCGIGNFKSSAIPKRLGYKLEGIERDGERHSYGYIDLEIYSILKREWCYFNQTK